MENERTDLSTRLEQLEALHHTLEESIANTQGLLAAEQVRSSALEANKAEVSKKGEKGRGYLQQKKII